MQSNQCLWLVRTT